MNTDTENIFETELNDLYRKGYDDGYNHGINNIYNPQSQDSSYVEGYDDGQTDSCEIT